MPSFDTWVRNYLFFSKTTSHNVLKLITTALQCSPMLVRQLNVYANHYFEYLPIVSSAFKVIPSSQGMDHPQTKHKKFSHYCSVNVLNDYKQMVRVKLRMDDNFTGVKVTLFDAIGDGSLKKSLYWGQSVPIYRPLVTDRDKISPINETTSSKYAQKHSLNQDKHSICEHFQKWGQSSAVPS